MSRVNGCLLIISIIKSENKLKKYLKIRKVFEN